MTHVLNKLPELSSALFSLSIERRIRPFKMPARYTDVIRFPDPQFSFFRSDHFRFSIRMLPLVSRKGCFDLGTHFLAIDRAFFSTSLPFINWQLLFSRTICFVLRVESYLLSIG
jgi:hypothetical protein